MPGSLTQGTEPSPETLIEEIDTLVADLIGAAKKPSLTTLLVVVAQVLAFIVSFGLITNTEEGIYMAIVAGVVNLGILIAQAWKSASANKAASLIVQAKIDLMREGWPNIPPPAPGTARLGRVRGN
jgi:uncharacterized membrane protein (UPF0136 family)